MSFTYVDLNTRGYFLVGLFGPMCVGQMSRKISQLRAYEPYKCKKSHNRAQHTTTTWHDASVVRHRPLPPPMALSCPFRRDVLACHNMGNAGYARFVFMRGGVSSLLFFFNSFLNEFSQSMGTSDMASAGARGSMPPVLVRSACSTHYGRR